MHALFSAPLLNQKGVILCTVVILGYLTLVWLSSSLSCMFKSYRSYRNHDIQHRARNYDLETHTPQKTYQDISDLALHNTDVTENQAHC